MDGEYGWLCALEADIASGTDRTDALDELFQVTFSGDDREVELASRCLAMMARRGCEDMRVFSILMSLRDVSDRVSENVCRGLGELSHAGIGDADGLDYAVRCASSSDAVLRATAVWSAASMMKHLGLDSEGARRIVSDAADDDSPLMRMCSGNVFI